MERNGNSSESRFGTPPSLTGAHEERSLDPDDWSAFRDLCSQELDGLIDHLASTAERPVWRPVPESVKQELAEPLPVDAQGPQRVCDDVRRAILPHTLGNTHPRFFGWVHGNGTAGGLLAELYAAAINANLGGREHAPVYVERTVIDWCKQIFQFPATASGMLLSGTSMANLVAISVARNHHSSVDIRAEGVAAAPQTMVAYTSAESHCSVAKAIEFLGLGRKNLRMIPVNDNFEIDLEALQEAIDSDRANGLQPFCVVGTAGTVNCAAVDDLDGLASICEHEKLWFHVDGAFGAMAMLSDEFRSRLRGIERADSLAFDFHKWLHVPYDAGCVLIRDGAAHRAAFSTKANYLSDGRGAAAGAPWFCEFGPELSRGFRALKVWFTLKEHGLRRLGEKITDNCRQARFLAELVDGHPRLERLAPVTLNIVCFRFVQPGLNTDDLDRLNSELVIALQERGIAVPSTTRIRGQLAIRVNLTNHRTTRNDLQILINAIENLAPTVLQKFPSTSPKRIAVSALHAKLHAKNSSAERKERTASRMIDTACSRAELQPLLNGVSFGFDAELTSPFIVNRNGDVVLGNEALANVETCAATIRHAVELVAMQRSVDEISPLAAVTIALLACRNAAMSFRAKHGEADVTDPRRFPAWLSNAYSLCRDEPVSEFGQRKLAELVATLLPLQGVDSLLVERLSADEWDEVKRRVRKSESAAGPTESLLIRDGDPRLEIDPATETSRYGCRRVPLPGLASFGSSTATTVSRQNLHAAEQVRRRLMRAAAHGDFEKQFHSETASLKRRLLEFCGVTNNEDNSPAQPELVLCGSGTDAELMAVGLAAQLSNGRLTNIVIAPDETGTGVSFAAAGRHFSTRTSLGTAVVAGSTIEGIDPERIDVVAVIARDSTGQLRPPEELDRETEQAVKVAVQNGHCLLHWLDSSKTGWGAPSVSCIRRLAEKYRDRLSIVVDACQMRVDRKTMAGYLREGFLLQVTGSKSFGGPPFCGALVIPPRWAARLERPVTLPSGLRDYVTQTDWPVRWSATRAMLPKRCNVGSLLRWSAALREMGAFYSVPEAWRTAILRELADEIHELLATTNGITAVATDVLDRGEFSAPNCWDRIPSIFPFQVAHRNEWLGGANLSHDQMRLLHRRLNTDLSTVPEFRKSMSVQSLAGFVAHIGQPVELCRTPGSRMTVLRVCTGANVVSRIAFDATLGTTVDARLQSERRRIRRLFQKIGLILDHWDAIERFEASRAKATDPDDQALPPETTNQDAVLTIP